MHFHQLPLCILSLLSLTTAFSPPDLHVRDPDPDSDPGHYGPAQALNTIRHPRDPNHHTDPFSSAHHALHARGTAQSSLPVIKPLCFGDAKEYCEGRCVCKPNNHLDCPSKTKGWYGPSRARLMAKRLVFCAPSCRCQTPAVDAGISQVEALRAGGEREKGMFGVAPF